MQLTVLGPQRHPTLDHVARSLDLDGPVATVTAGWQEREGEDAELDGLLGGRSVNLGLHGRWMDVLERDPEFAVAELEHRAVLDELQLLYQGQLDHALRAVYDILARSVDRPRAVAAATADALSVVRLVDRNHRARVRAAHQDFYGAWRLEERSAMAEHRADVHRILGSAAGLVVAGGHVGVLVRTLHLFHVAPSVPEVVVAWSAGAMALTDAVVLFHDLAPQQPAHAEYYDQGIGLVEGVVLLPNARRRLRVDDPVRMAVLAQRFAPASCVVLDEGVRLDLPLDGQLPAGARVVDDSGRIVVLEPA